MCRFIKYCMLFIFAVKSYSVYCQNDEIYDSAFLKQFTILAKRQCMFPSMMLPDTQQLKTLNFAYYICNANCTLIRVQGFIKGPSTEEESGYYDSVKVDYLLAYSPVYIAKHQTQTIHHFRKIYGFRHNDKKHQKQVIKLIRKDSKIQEWLFLPKEELRRSLRRLKQGCSECLMDRRFLKHRRMY
jgi:hypothetical protein